MSKFKKYRVGDKFKLSRIDPDDTSFLTGDEAAERDALDAMSLERDELLDLLHGDGRR